MIRTRLTLSRNLQDLVARDEHLHDNLKAEARTLADIVLTEVSSPHA